VSVEGKCTCVVNKALEFLIARYEIGLGVDLNHGPDGSLCRDPDQPFGGNSPSLAGGRCQTFLSQPVDGGLDVATALAERPLAIHHARAGPLAQLLDQRGGHFRHLRQTPV